tara:strand:- start:316 stop:450 length:135 start_codon:yes stop_codon:yes gene_type:complete
MKLNLACWYRNIPGFIHVDTCDMGHINKENGILVSLNIEAVKNG